MQKLRYVSKLTGFDESGQPRKRYFYIVTYISYIIQKSRQHIQTMLQYM